MQYNRKIAAIFVALIVIWAMKVESNRFSLQAQSEASIDEIGELIRQNQSDRQVETSLNRIMSMMESRD